jgi:hypothetical protein
VSTRHPDDAPVSAWASLGPIEQVREWEEFQEGSFKEMLEFARSEAKYKREAVERAARHERVLDYWGIGIQVGSIACALVAVFAFVLVARFYAEHNAASQGARILGYGTASTAAAFLGVNVIPIVGRLRARQRHRE